MNDNLELDIKGSVDITKKLSQSQILLWHKCNGRIKNAGYGPRISNLYSELSILVLQHFGNECLQSFTSSLSLVAIKASKSDAFLMCQATMLLIKSIPSPKDFTDFHEIVLELARKNPAILRTLFDRGPNIIQQLGFQRWLVWVESGLKLSINDSFRGEQFFNLRSQESKQILYRQAGNFTFQLLERQLRLETRALFGITPILREIYDDKQEVVKHRSSFSGRLFMLPSAYANSGNREVDTYRAASFHLAAHYVYGGRRFKIEKLKPMQIAIISIIEDARVEWLASEKMPGLRNFWRSFHSVSPDGIATAPSLLTRLSRALIDPTFNCSDAWVQKGKKMFFQAQESWSDPRISRLIGNLLGHDLGQLRVQFNAKDYVVNPNYKDDNLGLWDFEQDEMDMSNQNELMVETTEFKQNKSNNGETQKNKEDDNVPEDNETGKLKTARIEEDNGVLITKLPEYDYQRRVLREDWISLYEFKPLNGATNYWQVLEENYSSLIRRTEKLVGAMAMGRKLRLKKQAEGEKLDVDSTIEAAISYRAKKIPDTNIYEGSTPPQRSIAIHLLVDTSASTGEKITSSDRTILDLEKDATGILMKAVDKLGDPIAVTSFCSIGKDQVRIQRIKYFNESLNLLAGMNISGMQSQYSTRMGPVIRYTGESFKNVHALRKLVLIITDGEPSDIDVSDKEYLVHDAKHAVNYLKNLQIDAFCVALGNQAGERANEIFGKSRYVTINNINNLPDQLAKIYLRMTS